MPDPFPSLLAYPAFALQPIEKFQDFDGTSLENYAVAPISGGLTWQVLVSA